MACFFFRWAAVGHRECSSDSMNSFLALILLLGVVALLRIAFQKALSGQAKSRASKISQSCERPNADCLPYAKRKYFFSAAERSFYEVLRRLLPDYTVFAKVRLVDVIRVTKESSSWRSDLNRIDRKHLDFVLCDRDLAPALAVELDDSSHDQSDRAERDEFVDQVLAAANFPIVHVRAQRGYQLDELREILAPYITMRAQAPAEAAVMNGRYAPPVGWRPAT